MNITDIITDKITFGGKSFCKINGKAVFVPYAIPGEKISINITTQKKDYDEAEIVNIIEPSEHRVKPECKYYGLCGGCNMMHIDSEYQKELRKQILHDLFENNGINLKAEEIEIISGPSSNYRARFQLNDGGLTQKNSNNIVKIDNCICAEKPINAYFSETTFENRPKGRIHLFGSEKAADDSKNYPKIALPEEKKETKIIQSKKSSKKIKQKQNHYFAGTSISEDNTVTVQVSDKKISFDVRGFFQSNLYVFEKTADLIRELLFESENILDMYAGCGSLSVFAADKAKKITLVEHNRDALVFAEQNLAGIPHTSYGFSGEKWVKTAAEACPRFDSAIVDPPRSGMEKEVLDYFCKSKIPQILSMSCDPSTQARDLSKLLKNGYEIHRVFLLDFYPNTSHIETLVELRLKL